MQKLCKNDAKAMTLGEPATGAHLPVSCPQLQFSSNDRLRLKRGNERKVFFERSNEGPPNPLANQPIEVASPAYYYFKSISTGNKLPESVHLQGIAGHTIEVSYEGVPLPHASKIFPEEETQDSASRITR
jgi:hypothetical protein